MKCSARFSQVRASLQAWAPDGSTIRQIRWAYSSMGPLVAAEPRGVRPCCSAARQARIRPRSYHGRAARTVAVHEEIVLRKPFGQLKHFCPRGRRSGPAAADRRADVGPLCDLAARHGRADAAEASTSTSPTGATRSCVPLAEGSFDLDDYIDYLIEFLETIGETTGERPHMLAVCQPCRAGLRRDRADERGQEHVAAAER